VVVDASLFLALNSNVIQSHSYNIIRESLFRESLFAGVLWWLMHPYFWHSTAMWLGSTLAASVSVEL